MQDALARLWEQRRKTVVFVTDDAEEALYLADRIVVLTQRPGRIQGGVRGANPAAAVARVALSPAFLALKRKVWEATGNA